MVVSLSIDKHLDIGAWRHILSNRKDGIVADQVAVAQLQLAKCRGVTVEDEFLSFDVYVFEAVGAVLIDL